MSELNKYITIFGSVVFGFFGLYYLTNYIIKQSNDQKSEQQNQSEQHRSIQLNNKNILLSMLLNMSNIKNIKNFISVPQVSAPVVAPIRTPVAAPIRTPVAAPIRTPVAARIRAPITTPVVAPIRAPVVAPIRTPVAARIRAPITAPVVPQVTAPVVAQVSAPVVPQVTAPVVPQVTAPVVPQVTAPVIPPIAASVVASVTAPITEAVAATIKAPVIPPIPANIPNNGLVQKKFAVIFGVSDYIYDGIRDLNYCDEDVIEWYKILKSEDYVIYIFSDEKNKNQIASELKININLIKNATKNNIFETIDYIYESVKTNDNLDGYKIAFIGAGHGGIYGKNIEGSFLLTYDEKSTNTNFKTDYITDRDLENKLKWFMEKNSQVLCILDNCHSGGFIDNFLKFSDKCIIISASLFEGLGYDNSLEQNGMLTYYLTDTFNTIKNYTNNELLKEYLKSFTFYSKNNENYNVNYKYLVNNYLNNKELNNNLTCPLGIIYYIGLYRYKSDYEIKNKKKLNPNDEFQFGGNLYINF